MHKDSKIFVAGHKGLVGSAIYANLKDKGYTNILTQSRDELDLLNTDSVHQFFETEKPNYVFLAAAKVGGIVANNTYRADFIYENLQIQNNVIHAAYTHQVAKLLFLGSTCIYPKEAPQPMPENCLLTGPLEYTNEPYAIAKIAGIKMCESYNLQYGTNFISVMPTNLYGPNDNFDLEKSHVLPALIRKIYLGKMWMEKNWDAILKDLNVETEEEALYILKKYGISKELVEIWGSGKPRREFLWSEDMADGCVYLMENIDFKELCKGMKEVRNTHINIGTGEDISIQELAELIQKTIGYQGSFVYNTSKPDGTMRKLTDCTKIHRLGWKHRIEIQQGVAMMYENYLRNH